MRVKTITIGNSDGKEVELSLEEAQDLYKELKAMFGETTNILTPIIIHDYVRPYYYPITWSGNTISCNIDSGSGLDITYNCEE